MPTLTKTEEAVAHFWGCFKVLQVVAFLFWMGYGAGYILGTLAPGTKHTLHTIVFSLFGAGLGAYLSDVPDWWRRYQIRRRERDRISRHLARP